MQRHHHEIAVSEALGLLGLLGPLLLRPAGEYLKRITGAKAPTKGKP